MMMMMMMMMMIDGRAFAIFGSASVFRRDYNSLPESSGMT
jgi:hypothetical protein